jgi:hypothetical protein
VTMPDFALEALAIVLAALGTTFLVREVNKAHGVEEVSHEMVASKDLVALYQTDLREFWIRSAMRSFNRDREAVERMATVLSNADIQTAAAQYGQFYQHALPKAARVWDELTVPAVLKKRHRDLWIGFWLLIGGLGVQFAVAVGKLAGYL